MFNADDQRATIAAACHVGHVSTTSPRSIEWSFATQHNEKRATGTEIRVVQPITLSPRAVISTKVVQALSDRSKKGNQKENLA